MVPGIYLNGIAQVDGMKTQDARNIFNVQNLFHFARHKLIHMLIYCFNVSSTDFSLSADIFPGYFHDLINALVLGFRSLILLASMLLTDL